MSEACTPAHAPQHMQNNKGEKQGQTTMVKEQRQRTTANNNGAKQQQQTHMACMNGKAEWRPHENPRNETDDGHYKHK